MRLGHILTIFWPKLKKPYIPIFVQDKTKWSKKASQATVSSNKNVTATLLARVLMELTLSPECRRSTSRLVWPPHPGHCKPSTFTRFDSHLKTF